MPSRKPDSGLVHFGLSFFFWVAVARAVWDVTAGTWRVPLLAFGMLPISLVGWLFWEFRLQGWLAKYLFVWWNPTPDEDSVMSGFLGTLCAAIAWVVMAW